MLVAFGAALGAAAVYAGWGRDFASFYSSAAAFAAGGDPYRAAVTGGAVNINLPHVTALLVPLTALPFDVAFGLWQAVQLTAWAGAVYLLLRGHPEVPRPEFVAAAALFPGTLAQIAQGQWGFALAWLVGMAWAAQCRGREVRAGLWIGLAAALKPFVGLLVILYVRRARVRGAAAAVAVVCFAFAGGLMVFGSDLYTRWSSAVSAITWAGYPSNASLLGLAQRTLPEHMVTATWLLAAAAVGVATLVACTRRADEAVTWTLALAAALLVSPLGWLYYGWILAPSLISLRNWPTLLKVGLVLLWVPPGWFPALSTASVGLVVLWFALLVETGTHATPVRDRS